MESKDKKIRGLLAITFVMMISVNVLANVIPINGVSTGRVSDSYPNLFAPAGVTFTIWGLIYLLLALHVLYQLGLFRGGEKQVNDIMLQKTAIAFSISSLINFIWIFSWHFKAILLSMILMVGLLICLIYIVNLINTHSLTVREKIFIQLPFSVYFGWITIATIANVTTFFVSIGWKGLGLQDSTWTVIMLAIGSLIGVLTAVRFNDIAYIFVFIWAYIGILIKNMGTLGFLGQYQDIMFAVIFCIIIFVVTIICVYISKKRYKPLQ